MTLANISSSVLYDHSLFTLIEPVLAVWALVHLKAAFLCSRKGDGIGADGILVLELEKPQDVVLYGFGRIGKNIFKHLKLMSNNVHFFDPNVKKTKGIKKYQKINEFLKNTNCLIICAKLNKNNYKFFNTNKLKLLKKGSVVINISRGEIIHETDLIKLLKSKHISSYGTDVVSNEHMILKKQNPLINYSKNNSNIIISPHIGGLTFESEVKALNVVMSKLFKKI